jgi:hypothetical protein
MFKVIFFLTNCHVKRVESEKGGLHRQDSQCVYTKHASPQRKGHRDYLITGQATQGVCETVSLSPAQNGEKEIDVLAEAIHFQGKGKLLGKAKVRWTKCWEFRPVMF